MFTCLAPCSLAVFMSISVCVRWEQVKPESYFLYVYTYLANKSDSDYLDQLFSTLNVKTVKNVHNNFLADMMSSNIVL